MCDAHHIMYRDALSKPIRGLDPMTANDEYFRPSLAEVIRHGQIAVAFEDRIKAPMPDPALMRPGDEVRYTQEQIPHVIALRRALRHRDS